MGTSKLDAKMTMIRVGAANIKAWAEQIVEAINENFDGYDDLQTIEILMDRIVRESTATKNEIMEAYDELEEE